MPGAQQQVSAYWSVPWPLSLFGALERLFTIPTQIALSVLVLQAFTRRQPLWLVAAILWHALVDGVVVYLSATWAPFAWRVYALEGVIGIFAIIGVGMIFALKRPEPPEEEEVVPVALEATPTPVAQVEEDEEKIENSRYV